MVTAVKFYYSAVVNNIFCDNLTPLVWYLFCWRWYLRIVKRDRIAKSIILNIYIDIFFFLMDDGKNLKNTTSVSFNNYIIERVWHVNIFCVRIRRFLVTLDTIDILYHVYLNSCEKNIISLNVCLRTWVISFIMSGNNILSNVRIHFIVLLES